MGGERAQQSHPDVLENARKSRHSYDTDATRASLTAAVKSAFNGNESRKFQLDIAEALILGLDVTAIAGTGSGKTLPWVMPLLLEENRDKTVLAGVDLVPQFRVRTLREGVDPIVCPFLTHGESKT